MAAAGVRMAYTALRRTSIMGSSSSRCNAGRVCLTAIAAPPPPNPSQLHVRHKSKRARPSSVETPPHSAGDSAVPVLQTKGKGAKGAKGAPHGARTKRGDKEQQAGSTSEGYTESDRREDHVEGEHFNLEVLSGNMTRAVERCETTVRQLVGRIGRADPSLLDSVKVSYPGGGDDTLAPLRDFATVGSRDGALLITMYDADMIKHVERAIYTAGLDLVPQTIVSDHETLIRIPVPRPTSETRAALLKDISRVCENARISIRSARQIGQKKLKKDVDEKIVGTSEAAAEGKKLEAETKKATASIDAVFEQYKKKVEAETD